jgi:hypothetical protein
VALALGWVMGGEYVGGYAASRAPSRTFQVQCSMFDGPFFLFETFYDYYFNCFSNFFL